MRFVDEVRLTVSSGRGGSGCVSFLREKFRPRGGPNGGSGGKGGSVIFRATRSRNTLVDLKWNKVYRADNGDNGQGRDMTGADGGDLTVLVPIGTVLSDLDSGELVADLHEAGAVYTVEGGDGGRGNATFKTSTNRTPRFATEGWPGVELKLQLELKLLADVGLLGFPNAGKSTLISRISAAKPKIADYPFTTLVPNLGVVKMDEGKSFVVADIPGLIAGAAEGHGLGHQFLRHVERCRLFLHLVAPDDSEMTAVQRYQAILAELEKYDDSLLERPRFTILTKSDLVDEAEQAEQVAQLTALTGRPVACISSITGEGLKSLRWGIWNALQTLDGVDVIEDDDSEMAEERV
jgi:GTP-binding protein